ncbi:MAG: GGDEF domain-containing protein [Opitutaceae bacterium]
MPANTYEALKAANRLPTPPGVAIRILQLVENEDTTLDELTQVISSDPALTAKILKYINSPIMGLGFHGSSLQEAVARIGIRGTQMMALSFSLITQTHAESCPSFQFEAFWSESLARGVAARRLARDLGGWDSEEAFISGLVCRIGKLALSIGMPEAYEPILSGAVHPEIPLERRERLALEGSHVEIGIELLRDWQLPEKVWKAAEGLVRIDDQAAASRCGGILRVADAIAAFLMIEGGHNAAAMQRLSGLALTETGLEPPALRALMEAVSEDWSVYGKLFSVDTQKAPDFDAIEREAEEHRNLLRLASEMEVVSLKSENKELSELARRDRMTGMLNRAAFDESLPAAVAGARDQERSLAVLMIDVDRFKSINDTHGHPAGDSVLKHLARILDDNARRRDEVFRYGGEEFVVIAPDCSKEGAGSIAEGFRAAVEATPHVELKRTIPLTISVGVAWVDSAHLPENPTELVEFADQRLYEAKHGGRNQWRIDPQETAATMSEPAVSSGGGLFSRLLGRKG